MKKQNKLHFANTDFVGVYEDAFDDNYCNELIKFFELAHQNQATYTRQETEKVFKTVKNDVSKDFSFYTNFIEPDLYKKFLDTFWQVCYKHYAQDFDILNGYPPHKIFHAKLQKTTKMGGYHIWHSEDCDRDVTNRLLTFILYLNDVQEGGETEFLYLSRRIKPKTGTLVIWPAGFTHTHRGNPPLSNSKYVMTGWVEM